MVRQDSRWEISAMPDATVVSSPYALGTTMVFSPSGMASAQRMQISNPAGRGSRSSTPMYSRGNRISRISETLYTDTVRKVDF